MRTWQMQQQQQMLIFKEFDGRSLCEHLFFGGKWHSGWNNARRSPPRRVWEVLMGDKSMMVDIKRLNNYLRWLILYEMIRCDREKWLKKYSTHGYAGICVNFPIWEMSSKKGTRRWSVLKGSRTPEFSLFILDVHLYQHVSWIFFPFFH